MIGVLFLSSMFGMAAMVAGLLAGVPVAAGLLVWPLVGTGAALVLFVERVLVPIPVRERSRPGPGR